MRVAAAIAFGTFCFYSWLALLFPVDLFRKYTFAADLFQRGAMDAERWMDFSPLYLRWTLFMQSWFGDPARWMEWTQIALSALSIGGVFILFDRRFPRRWALAGAVAVALDRHILVYQRILEPEALLLFFVVGLLVLLDDFRGAWRFPLLAGCVGALGILTRATLLPICLGAALGIWILRLRPSDSDEPKTPISVDVRRTVLFLAPALFVLLLSAWWAHGATGSSSTPAMNPGTVLFEGNHPMSQGTSAVYPPVVNRLVEEQFGDGPDSAHAHYRRVARADDANASNGVLSVEQVNGFWSQKVRAFYLDEPTVAVKRLGTKLLYLFHGFRWHDLPAAWVYDRYLPVPSVPFSMLSALALLGMLTEARRWDRSFMLYLILAAQSAAMMVFYVSPRQRLILVPILVFFALSALRHGLKERSKLGAVLALLLTLCFALPDASMDDAAHFRRGMEEARGLLGEVSGRMAEGEPVVAVIDPLTRALAAAPWTFDQMQPAFLPRQGFSLEQAIIGQMRSETPQERFDLGAMLWKIGDLDKAQDLLMPLAESGLRLYRQGKTPDLPEIFLGRIAIEQGRDSDASTILSDALARYPGNPFLLAELFILDGDPAHRQWIERYYSPSDADFLIGSALLQHGRAAKALPLLKRLAEAYPKSRRFHLMAAAAAHRSGDSPLGLRHLKEADTIRLEPVLFSDDMVALYEGSLESRQGLEPRERLRAAQGFFHYGQPRKALEIVQQTSWPHELQGSSQALAQRIQATLAAMPDAL